MKSYPENDTPLDRDYLTLKVPENADVVRVVLRNSSDVVAELTLGATPAVRIDSPAQGELYKAL